MMIIEYSETIKPRIYDINYGGHLGHIELIKLLHEVRAQFLKKHQVCETEIDGCVLMMRQLSVTYLNEAFWDNELIANMTLEFNKAKIIFKYIVLNLSTNNLTAEAEATMVLVNKQNHKIVNPRLFFEKIKGDRKSRRNFSQT